MLLSTYCSEKFGKFQKDKIRDVKKKHRLGGTCAQFFLSSRKYITDLNKPGFKVKLRTSPSYFVIYFSKKKSKISLKNVFFNMRKKMENLVFGATLEHLKSALFPS